MKFETKISKLGINENEVKSIVENCECGEINGAYLIDLTKEKKEFIMEVIGNYLDDDSGDFEGWTDIKRISTFCKIFGISEEEIPKYYILGFNEGGEDIAYLLESNKDVILVLTEDERYINSFISQSESKESKEEIMSRLYQGKNQKIEEIMCRYEHYGYMNHEDIAAFREYRDEINKTLNRKEATLRCGIINGLKAEHFCLLEAEVANINYINDFKIYTNTQISLATMNGILYHLWYMEQSGYDNNPFFDFKKLVEQVNCYWKIENPHKAPNKVAYGWKFSMDKADSTGYYCKGWKLYMWGCIKNYLVQNGVEFNKDESLKVRKIVGLMDIYDVAE